MESARSLETANIGILGTGDFARAMTSRLTTSDLHVIIGSRNPAKRQWLLKETGEDKVKLTTIDDCVKTCDVIFLAMHPQHHASLGCHDDMLREKILIDVSNARDNQSNAMKLSAILPNSHVIKAFNTVSVYNLNNDIENATVIPICGDNKSAKYLVTQLIFRLGLMPINSGGIKNAARLEKRNMQLFPGWGRPTIAMFVVLLIWFGLALLKYYYLLDPQYIFSWQELPMNVMNKVIANTAITCLAFVYLPGSFAGLTQLCWGTKQRRFSAFLDGWLKMRKQLGLYALFYGVIHMVISATLTSPAYYFMWFKTTSQTVPANATSDTIIQTSSKLNWVGETCIFLGVLALALMSLLGVTSLPSVSRSMNWREWRCVQSYVGFACLLLAFTHMMFKIVTFWDVLAFWGMPVPGLALLLRLVLFLPCCHVSLDHIRSGDVERTETSHRGRSDLPETKHTHGDTNLTFCNGHSDTITESSGL